MRNLKERGYTRLDHCCLGREALVWNAGDLGAGEVVLGESQQQNEASVLQPPKLTLAGITFA